MPHASDVLKAEVKETSFDVGLSDKYREEASAALSDILAGTYKLLIKSQVYHWNVVGPLFKPIHELTEENYNALFSAVDVIAERIRALGYLAPISFGDMKSFAPTGSSVDHTSAKSMVEDLIADHEASVRAMRDLAGEAGDAGDMVTEDMITERLTFHEKTLWMLGAIIAD